MRILVVSDLPPHVVGGAEIQAARLVAAWADAGNEVRVAGRRIPDGCQPLGPHTVRTLAIPTRTGPGRPGRALTYAWSLTRVLLANRGWADVVYTRFLHEAAATVASMRAMGIIRAPLVATPANTGGRGEAAVLSELPGGKAVIRLLDRHCSAINLIAPAMADELRAIGFRGTNFTFVPNGIPLHPLPPRTARAETRLLAVGRLAPQKGFDLLLRALAPLSLEARSVRLTVVGDGPEREALEALSRELGLGATVRWAGEQSVDAMGGYYDDADIFVLPSRYEGLSNAGLEAMERGLPLVITRCGGLDRHVDASTGWLCEPGDAADLSRALEGAVRTPVETRTNMGLAARRYAERTFSMDTVAARYLELFATLQKARR